MRSQAVKKHNRNGVYIFESDALASGQYTQNGSCSLPCIDNPGIPSGWIHFTNSTPNYGVFCPGIPTNVNSVPDQHQVAYISASASGGDEDFVQNVGALLA